MVLENGNVLFRNVLEIITHFIRISISEITTNSLTKFMNERILIRYNLVELYVLKKYSDYVILEYVIGLEGVILRFILNL